MATEKYLIQIKVDIKNDKQLQALTTQLQKAAKQAPVTAQAMKKASVGTKRFGQVAQNAGYQVQDFAIQVQGGVDPMRAFSQQVPQLLVGFGAWGAAIGVVAALLPSLITLIKDGDEATSDWDESLTLLNEAMSELGKVGERFNLDSWAAEFNKVDEAAQASMLTILNYQALALRVSAENAASGIQEGQTLPTSAPGISTATKQGKAEEARLAALAAAQVEVAESYGVTIDKVNELGKSLDAVRNSGGLDAIATQEALDILRQSALETGQVTEENRTLTKQLTTLQSVQEQYAVSTERAAQASMGYGVVLSEVAAQSEAISQSMPRATAAINENTKAVESGASAAALAAIEANDLKQMRIEAILDAPKYTKAVVEQAEAFSLLDESTSIFLNTFDSAVDGVARGTQSMSDAFESMAKSILLQIGKLLAIQGIGTALSGQGGFLGQVGASLLAEKGAVVSGGHHVTAYANGGVVNGPTLFPMAKGTGLMGEAGAEAIMPLSRMSNGNLGVESSGMNVVINNNASGVQVNPRQTDEGLTIDVVMSAVSQAVRRGGNEVAESFEQSYALNRGKAVYGN